MAKQQKETIRLPAWVADLDGADRRDIADAIVEFIRDRSEQGVGVKKVGASWRERTFPDYTEAYAEFKGVSRSSVDLRLSSEMLESLDYLEVKPTAVVIGYSAGDDLNGRVEGNRIGSYGRSPNARRARDFLGITKADLALILDPYKPGGK